MTALVALQGYVSPMRRVATSVVREYSACTDQRSGSHIHPGNTARYQHQKCRCLTKQPMHQLTITNLLLLAISTQVVQAACTDPEHDHLWVQGASL